MPSSVTSSSSQGQNMYLLTQPAASVPSEFQNINLLPLSDTETEISLFSSSENVKSSPYIEIIKEPKSKMRFRYESEKGSHGCITAVCECSTKNCECSKKDCYPTVKLKDYNGTTPVYISASLYTTEDPPRPHVHKLTDVNPTISSTCERGICTIKVDANRTAVFQKLNILYSKQATAREILFERKIAGKNPITEEEKQQLLVEAKDEAKRMDLNNVRILFQAFYYDQTTQSNHLFDSIFSKPIFHQVNELKITRIDRFAGSAKGGEEVFLLCEKVEKKNIEVRFVQYNEQNEILWEDKGSFTEADVHHQYAIVFKTPPYKTTELDEDVIVHISLYRPKNKDTSEELEFRYKASDNYEDNGVRKRKKVFQPIHSPLVSPQASTSSDYQSSTGEMSLSSPSVPSTSHYATSDSYDTDIELPSLDDVMEVLQNENRKDCLDIVQWFMHPESIAFDPFVHEDERFIRGGDPLLSSTNFQGEVGEMEFTPKASHMFEKDSVGSSREQINGPQKFKIVNENIHMAKTSGYSENVFTSTLWAMLNYNTEFWNSAMNPRALYDNAIQFLNSLINPRPNAGNAEKKASSAKDSVGLSIESKIVGKETITDKPIECIDELTDKIEKQLNIADKTASESLKVKITKLCETINSCDKDGNTLLHLAIMHHSKDISMIRNLLRALTGQAGVELINRENKFKLTPIHYSIMHNANNILQMLTELSYNPLNVTSHGDTYLHFAIKYKAHECLRTMDCNYMCNELDRLNDDGLTALHCAIMGKDEYFVTYLCNQEKCDVNIQERKSGKNALHLAIENFPDIIEYLLTTTRIDVDQVDFAGRTALDLALLHNLPQAKLLDDFPFLPNRNLNIKRRNNDGTGKEIQVSNSNHIEMVQHKQKKITGKLQMLDLSTLEKVSRILNSSPENLQQLGLFMGMDNNVVNTILTKEDNPAEAMIANFEDNGNSKTDLLNTLSNAGLNDVISVIENAR